MESAVLYRHGSLILTVTFQLICLYAVLALAENDGEDAGVVKTLSSTTPLPGAGSSTAPPDFLEQKVGGIRIWMIIGLILAGLLVVVIALCCIFDCRIPRTKQEIEAENERRQAVKQDFVNAAQRIQKAQKTLKVAAAAKALKSQGSLTGASSIAAPSDGLSRRGQTPEGIELGAKGGSMSGSAPSRTTSETKARINQPPSETRGDGNGSKKFRGDFASTVDVLTSLPRKANSAV